MQSLVRRRTSTYVHLVRQRCFSSSWALELEPKPSSRKVTPSDVQLAVPTRPWTNLGIHQRVAHALVCAGFKTPTNIQTIAARSILTSSNSKKGSTATLIAAETGAGKTFAYIVPLLSQLHTREFDINARSTGNTDNNNTEMKRVLRRPRVIILTPTRELVAQVRTAAIDITKGLASIRTFTGGHLRKIQQKHLGTAPLDILVVTPQSLDKLRKDRSIFLSHVQFVVLDEADVLLKPSGGFDESINSLLKSLGNISYRRTEQGNNNNNNSVATNASNVQHIYVAASVPLSLRSRLSEGRQDLVVAKTDNLHHGPNPDKVRCEFRRINGTEEDKFKAAVEIVRERMKRDTNGRIMIFCDGHVRRERLTDAIREHLAVPVVHISGGKQVEMEARSEAWNAFRDVRHRENTDGDAEAATRVAVCAQSYGRGIDHTGVTSVIMIDVPMTGTEYMHRAGRIRGSGSVVTLVGRRERSMATALFIASAKKRRLAGLTAQVARNLYPKGMPKPLLGEDAKAVALAKKKGHVAWIEPRASSKRRRHAHR